MKIALEIYRNQKRYIYNDLKMKEIPRVGEIVRTPEIASARVTDVAWSFDTNSGNQNDSYLNYVVVYAE